MRWRIKMTYIQMACGMLLVIQLPITGLAQPSSLQSGIQATSKKPPSTGPFVRESSLELPPQIRTQKLILNIKQQSLPAVLREVQRQTGLLVLADDLPLVGQATISFDGAAADGLDLICNRFDYVWSVSKHGAVLLHKRFHDPKDYPTLNQPELRAIARDVRAMLQSELYVPGGEGSPTDRLKILYRSLSMEQIQRMVDGGVVRGAELTPLQARCLGRMVHSLGFHEMTEAWQQLLDRLTGLPQASLRFDKVENKDLWRFSIVFQSQPDRPCVLRLMEKREVETLP